MSNLAILEQLPAIHATIIGIVAAFYAAFSAYAYQQISDAKSDIQSSLENLTELSKLSSLSFETDNEFIKKDGTMDWDSKGKGMLLYAATTATSLFTREAQNSSPIDDSDLEHNYKTITDTYNNLRLLLSTVFTSYPFWNDGSNYIEGQTSQVVEASNVIDEGKRFQDMNRVLFFLDYIWNRSGKEFVVLAHKYTECKFKEKRDEINKMKEDKNPDFLHHDRIHFLEESLKRDLNKAKTEATEPVFILEVFEKVKTIKCEILPVILKQLSTLNHCNEKYKLKDTSTKVIQYSIFITLSGIILPLTLLEVSSRVTIPAFNTSMIFIEYIILLATMSPYFYFFALALRKIKSLDENKR
ncbi:hypothetical protein [Aeromonas veronii]|uniref:hypothetical protein n=1 Tax=Aeromonas veronii TaxID=654 RepID=UPI003BA0CF8C